MPIYKGKKKVIALYKGAIPIIKKYKGNILLFDSTPKKNNILSFEFTGTEEKYYINDVEYTATTSPFSIEIEDTITSAANMFASNGKNTITAITSLPDVSQATDMSNMFTYLTGITDSSILETIDTSSCVNMFQMLAAVSATELDLSNYNTSNVTSMYQMFTSSSFLTTLNIKNWDVSKVTTMQQMFNACTGLTELDLSGWDVTSVTDFGSMFARCFSLKTIDVTGWNTLNSGTGHSDKPIFGVKSTIPKNNSSIYANLEELVVGEDCSDEQYEWWCARLEESGIDCNVIKYKNIETTSTLTFNWTYTGNSQPTFYTQNSASDNTFYTATTNPYTVDIAEDQDKIVLHNLNVVEISSLPNDRSWRGIAINNFIGNNLVLKDIDLTKATRLYSDLMISSAPTSSSIDLSGLKLSDTVDMSDYNSPKVNTLIMDDWYFNNVYSIFNGNNVLKNLSLKNVNTSNVTDMNHMFYNCSGLTSIDLSSFDTSNVTDMSYMFYSCSGLTSLELSNFNTENVKNLSRMFQLCSNITSLDLSGWNTSKVTDMIYMFSYCRNLTTLNVTGWDISNVTNYTSMFNGIKSTVKIILGDVSYATYNWWYSRLKDAGINNTATLEYTINNSGGGTSEAE